MCSIVLQSKLWFSVSSFLWMGNSMPLNGSGSAGIDCKSCLCGPTEESCIKHEKYTSDFEKSMKTNPLEDLEISSSTEEEQELEHWIVQVLGASLSEVLHVHDNLGPQCVSDLALDQDENCINQGTQPLLLYTGMLDGPNMHETVLCSSVVQPYPLTLNAVEDLSCSTVDKGKFSMEAPASAYPLPVKELISAFKGSREKQGERLSTKLSVRWAPEVYDPPITSTSHTMKGHHHHKTKKDYFVHKCTKGKSSRGSERKHTHHRSSDSSSLMDPWILRSRSLSLHSKEAVRNEKQGERPSTKLSVKWAPEVYDPRHPPITSSSHKMGHHRHHHHKTKSKSSRGSERKHAHCRSSGSSLMDPRILRLQALRSSTRQELNSCYQSKMEHPEYAERSPENIIHGSSCYMEPLAPTNTLHVAKASRPQLQFQSLITFLYFDCGENKTG